MLAIYLQGPNTMFIVRKNEIINLVEESINLGNAPRVHPNGFIQLDLGIDTNKRLHVWRNDLPRQKVYTPVHNHRFDFTSETVVGALVNLTFELDNPDQGPPHREWVVRRDPSCEDTHLVPTPNIIGLVAVDSAVITAGNGYEFAAGAFHETSFIHNTVTIIHKSEPIPGIEAAVLVPEGIEPDNTFTRTPPSDELLHRKIIEALS